MFDDLQDSGQQDSGNLDAIYARENVLAKAKSYGLSLNSGKRSASHNAAVGGAPASNHLSGNAGDFIGPADKMKAFADDLAQNDTGSIKEIYHRGVGFKNGQKVAGIGGHDTHVHVAWQGAALSSEAKPVQDSSSYLDSLYSKLSTDKPAPSESSPDWRVVEQGTPLNSAQVSQIRDWNKGQRVQPAPTQRAIVPSQPTSREQSLSADFEQAKSEGRLEDANRAGLALQKEFGYEFGHQQDDNFKQWPYIKPPANPSAPLSEKYARSIEKETPKSTGRYIEQDRAQRQLGEQQKAFRRADQRGIARRALEGASRGARETLDSMAAGAGRLVKDIGNAASDVNAKLTQTALSPEEIKARTEQEIQHPVVAASGNIGSEIEGYYKNRADEAAQTQALRGQDTVSKVSHELGSIAPYMIPGGGQTAFGVESALGSYGQGNSLDKSILTGIMSVAGAKAAGKLASEAESQLIAKDLAKAASDPASGFSDVTKRYLARVGGQAAGLPLVQAGTGQGVPTTPKEVAHTLAMAMGFGLHGGAGDRMTEIINDPATHPEVAKELKEAVSSAPAENTEQGTRSIERMKDGIDVRPEQENQSNLTAIASGRDSLERNASTATARPADLQGKPMDAIARGSQPVATGPIVEGSAEGTGQQRVQPDGDSNTQNVVAEPVHHSNYQPRSDDGTFVEGKLEIPATIERGGDVNAIYRNVGSNQGIPVQEVGTGRAIGRSGNGDSGNETRPDRPGAAISDTATPDRAAAAPPIAAESTGLKKSVVNAERAARQADPIDDEGTRHWGPLWDKVKREVASGARDPLLLAKELNKTKRPVTDEEVATLLHGKRRTTDQHREAMTAVEDAIAKGDETAETSARVRAGLIEADRDAIEQATRGAVRENARGLSMMRGMVKDDYSLVNMIQRAKVARGEELPADVRVKLETLSKQLQEKDAALEKQAAQIADLQAKKSIKRGIEGETRQVRRAQKKADIEKEWGDLQSEFDSWAKKAASTTHAGIPVDGAKIIARMAKNRIQAGIVGVDELIDNLHTALKDKIDGLSRDDVRDTLAQYGVSGKPSEADLKAQLHELTRQLGELPKRTPDQAQAAAKTRLRNNIAQLEGQIARGNYTKAVKASPIEYDPEAKRLEADRNRLRQQVENEVEKQKQQNRSGAQKTADFIVKAHQEIVLSSTNVFTKLGSAALGRIITQPMEQGINSVWGKVMPSVARRAPIEGGFKGNVEWDTLKRTFSKETAKEMRNELPVLPTLEGGNAISRAAIKMGANKVSEFGNRVMKGKSGTDLAALHDEKASTTPEEIRLMGHFHGALKVPAKINTFYRALGKQTEYYTRQQIENGASPEEAQAYVQRPEIQALMSGKAYQFAQRNILMADNAVSRGFSRLMNMAHNAGDDSTAGGKVARLTGRGVEFIGKFLYPVTKVAPNFVSEVASYTPVGALKAGIQGSGLIKAKLQGAEAFQKALANLKPEDADYIMRNMSKATLGTAMMALGFGLRDNIGGYYNQEDAKDKSKNAPDFGGMTIYGWKVPRVFLHTPLLESLQIGATIGHIYDKARASRHGVAASFAIGVGEGGVESLKGLAEEIPFFGSPKRMIEDEKREGLTRTLVKPFTTGFIPPDVQRASRTGVPFTGGKLGDLDRRGDVVKRAPRSVGEDVKNVIPVLRRSVPQR